MDLTACPTRTRATRLQREHSTCPLIYESSLHLLDEDSQILTNRAIDAEQHSLCLCVRKPQLVAKCDGYSIAESQLLYAFDSIAVLFHQPIDASI
jgi:hypothetical protein